MSFLKKLFGGGGDKASEAGTPAQTVEYRGFTISATPYQEGGQWQTSGVVSKTVNGEAREHRFIRADRFGDKDSAAEHAILKGRQIVDQLGEGMFR